MGRGRGRGGRGEVGRRGSSKRQAPLEEEERIRLRMEVGFERKRNRNGARCSGSPLEQLGGDGTLESSDGRADRGGRVFRINGLCRAGLAN